LVKKIYEVDPLECKRCGGEMEIVSFIRDPAVVQKILDHLEGLSPGNDPPRNPPDSELTYGLIYDDFPDGNHPDNPV
jgi:hypothetical protein